MSRRAAPSMPTPNQIEEVQKVVVALYPAARIAGVGPNGVIFEYPDIAQPDSQYRGKPFAPERK